MGVLAYKFPDEPPKYFEGEWKRASLSSISENEFFITDFQKSEVFTFDLTHQATLLDFPNEEHFFYIDEIPFAIQQEEYLRDLDQFKKQMSSLGIEKAIYSRVKISTKPKSLDFFFRKLCEKYASNALIYCVSSEHFGTWIGATPEILLEGNPSCMKTTSLAGTKLNATTPWTPKEKEEQQIVTDYISSILSTHLNKKDIHISSPYTFNTGAVFHLKSDFQFTLPKVNWFGLMNDLHPTPAVCGVPTKAAKALILSSEKHSRAFYTGIIGLRRQNELKSFVNLRCMQLLGEESALYLGGGITSDSNTEAEWEETENKSHTLLRLLY